MKDSDTIETGKGAIIREVLRKINERIFPITSIHLAWLKDCPEMIPVIVEWQYNYLSTYDNSLTREQLVDSLKSQLGAKEIPFTIVAVKHGKPVGSFSLEIESEPELSDLPGPWGVGFHVVPEERKRGVARELANALLTITEELGYSHIYFAISLSNFPTINMFLKQGAEIIDTRLFKAHTINILRMTELRLKPPTFIKFQK